LKDFAGKTAFITGGASGIGFALSEACCKEGMNVVIADIRRDALDEAMQKFSENDWPVHAIALDITDREAYVKAADEAEAKFGNIHLLMNNAGIACARGPLWEVSYVNTDLAMNINLTAVLTGIQVIVPRMLKHGEGGHIVSTASKAALIAVPNVGLYNFTKQALISITESLATDLQGTNVGASVFCPGPFLTGFGKTSGLVETIFLGKPSEGMPPRAGVDMKALEKLERSADEAAQRVLNGVRRGDLYIFTHAEFKDGFEARTNAMLRAFPDDVQSEEFKKGFSFLVTNPVFDMQTQVPKYEG